MSGPRHAAERHGRYAETLCVLRLTFSGWRIVSRRMKGGRGTGAGEIDIIAKRGNTLAFIEVKARSAEALALESVLPQQQTRIVRAAEAFLQRHPKLANCNLRFDVMILARGFWPRHVPDAWRP